MKFPAWFAIVVGVMMFGQWAFFLATGQVPELQTEPYRIAFHLAAEAMTAATLIAGGIGLLADKAWARTVYTVAIGMLLYTSIVSPGYFAQQGVWGLVVMFAVLIVAGLFSLRRVITR